MAERCSVVLVHHTARDGDVRGSIGWTQHVPHVEVLSRDGRQHDRYTLRVVKNRFGEATSWTLRHQYGGGWSLWDAPQHASPAAAAPVAVHGSGASGILARLPATLDELGRSTGLSDAALRQALRDLRESGQVAIEGRGRQARYVGAAG